MMVRDILECAKMTDFIFALSTFLDEFKNSQDKSVLINNSPLVEENLITESSIVAAVVHKLANDNNLAVPKWVFDEKYVLKQPYYQFDTKNKDYQAYLI